MDDSATIAVIGNANLDLVAGPMDAWPDRGTESFLGRSDTRIGGSAANTAIVLQRLGARSGLVATAGRDLVGDMIHAAFAGPLDRITTVDSPSSVTFGLLHSGSERTFFSTPGHLDAMDAPTINARLRDWPLDGAIALLAGSFALPGLAPESKALLAGLRARGARTAIDPGWPGGGWSAANRALALEWIRESDVILLNDKEVLGLTGCETISAACENLSAELRPGAELVIKRGPEGATLFLAGRFHDTASPPAEVLDTIGAGDAFNAGYLAARASGHAPPAALHAGCYVARHVIRDFPRGDGPLDFSNCLETLT
ncbi:carbohydrate kinase family protein [Tropicimonas sp. IMCC6043]|uniref:carbohydrate kinase family protein n=1 Tax=Tropicimonas sp. IMCC6043 TaxID=2510645 RepID=UPI00101D69FD|nr:carbohydrate kinase family protein [Tropicimonas sp. IMCC6043]RYH09418.1 carbohydrate kinase family protein [Tropicimonas sp. IMCC6043]